LLIGDPVAAHSGRDHDQAIAAADRASSSIGPDPSNDREHRDLSPWMFLNEIVGGILLAINHRNNTGYGVSKTLTRRGEGGERRTGGGPCAPASTLIICILLANPGDPAAPQTIKGRENLKCAMEGGGIRRMADPQEDVAIRPQLVLLLSILRAREMARRLRDLRLWCRRPAHSSDPIVAGTVCLPREISMECARWDRARDRAKAIATSGSQPKALTMGCNANPCCGRNST
jgi:hypothetical protein